jgi:hypothetical protein
VPKKFVLVKPDNDLLFLNAVNEIGAFFDEV